MRATQKASLKGACRDLLLRLAGGLADLQILEGGGDERGALRDPACGVLHTRAGEAVYPLAVAWREGGDERLREAALLLADWLLARQHEEGWWPETPGRWRGTTTDQLLALCGALPILAPSLGREGGERWRGAIRRAAGFLAGWIGEETAHLNYCATTAASLAAAGPFTNDPAHLARARELARRVAFEKMDEEGFLVGEGHRKDGVLFGVDPGYNLDMTLWSLALYARLTGDAEVEQAAARSLRAHLPLVYPDGLIDNSWGVRSNKWTTYGSKTAHGSQAAFAILARHDPRFPVAGLRTLRYLEGMIQDGLVGCGPQWWQQERTCCIYPTFTRASNLALAIDHGDDAPPGGSREPAAVGDDGSVVAGTDGEAALPCDAPFARLLSTVGVAIVRTRGLMATVAAYGYKAPGPPSRSKYMARPSGGGVSCLWFDGCGLMQAASQSRYHRWERIHFPEAGDPAPLGPRIEETRRRGLTTSLNEFDAAIELENGPEPAVISRGRLRDRQGRGGGVRYEWRHAFGAAGVEKRVRLSASWRGARPRIVEPLIERRGTVFTALDDRTVEITTEGARFRLRIEEGDATLSVGERSDRCWWPFPALLGRPVILSVGRIGPWGRREIRYVLERVEPDRGGEAT